MGNGLGQILGPETSICVLSMMHSEIWWPYSIMDLSLSEVPFLEEISFVLLVAWMDLSEENHLVHKLSLLETFINE